MLYNMLQLYLTGRKPVFPPLASAEVTWHTRSRTTAHRVVWADAKLGFQPSWVDVNRSLGKFRFREGGWWVVGGWNLHIEVHQVLQLP